MLSGEIPAHEMAAFGATLRTHPVAARLYWNWFKTNYDDLVPRFEGFYLSSSVAAPIAGFSTREDYEDVKSFFGSKDQTGYAQSVAQKLDGILSRMKWLERDSDDVEGWLRSNGFLM
jgi:aminopeptidase 2